MIFDRSLKPKRTISMIKYKNTHISEFADAIIIQHWCHLNLHVNKLISDSGIFDPIYYRSEGRSAAGFFPKFQFDQEDCLSKQHCAKKRSQSCVLRIARRKREARAHHNRPEVVLADHLTSWLFSTPVCTIYSMITPGEVNFGFRVCLVSIVLVKMYFLCILYCVGVTIF